MEKIQILSYEQFISLNEAKGSEIRFTANDLRRLLDSELFYTTKEDFFDYSIKDEETEAIVGSYNKKTEKLKTDNPKLITWLKENSFKIEDNVSSSVPVKKLKPGAVVVNFEGKEYILSAELKGQGVNPPLWGRSSRNNQFLVSVSHNGKKTSFDFFDSNANYTKGVIELNEAELKNAFYCFVSDSIFGMGSFEDYCDELGCGDDREDIRRSKKIYNACVKSYEKLSKLGIDDDTLYDLANFLQD